MHCLLDVTWPAQILYTGCFILSHCRSTSLTVIGLTVERQSLPPSWTAHTPKTLMWLDKTCGNQFLHWQFILCCYSIIFPNLLGIGWYEVHGMVGVRFLIVKLFTFFHAFLSKVLPYQVPVSARPGKQKSRPTSHLAVWKYRKVLQVSKFSNRECGCCQVNKLTKKLTEQGSGCWRMTISVELLQLLKVIGYPIRICKMCHKNLIYVAAG